MTYQLLIDVPTLQAHLADPNFRVVDCRFELGEPGAGRAVYQRGHIPAATYAHLDDDLSGPRTPWTGRHPLPDASTLAATFSRLGIDGDTQVVAYDDSGGAYAARLWWLLRWLGHVSVAVLDGGLAAWQAAGLPLSTSATSVAARRFVAAAPVVAQVTADELALLLARKACWLLDARSTERFEGRIEPLDPRAGHIPGASSRPFARNLGPDGRFLAPAALQDQLSRLLRGRPATEVVSMCGSGVTACHTLLALEIAGLSGARLYAGSWSEWCRDPARPVAVGP